MEVNFNRNKTIKAVGASHCELVDNKAILELFESIESTSLFDVNRVPSDAIMIAVYAYLAGKHSGIREERQRKRRAVQK